MSSHLVSKLQRRENHEKNLLVTKYVNQQMSMINKAKMVAEGTVQLPTSHQKNLKLKVDVPNELYRQVQDSSLVSFEHLQKKA